MRKALLVAMGVVALAVVAGVREIPPDVEAGTPIIVETVDDEVAVDGQCSLRQAISAANFDTDGGGDCETGSGADVIEIPNGVYELDSTLVISADVTLQGESTAGTILDGQGQYQVLNLVNEAIATNYVIRDLTIRNGDSIADGSPFNGGGIALSDQEAAAPTGSESLLLERVLMTGNQGIAGGAILVLEDAEITIRDSTFTGNTGTAQGHVAFVVGKLTIEDSRMSDNGDDLTGGNGGAITSIAPSEVTIIRTEIVNNRFEIDQAFPGRGGGLFNAGGVMTVINSTISGNRAQEGGGIFTDAGATTNLLHVTLADNEAVDVGGGHALGGTGTVNVISSIVTSDDPDSNCQSQVTSALTSIDSGATCGLDKAGTDPSLGSLTAVSGPTRIHPLMEGSPAIDAADADECPADDQSGAARPQGNGCDIGAFESALSAPTPTAVPTDTPEPTETAVPTESATATPSPTETGAPGEDLVWGDDNCSGAPDPVDALLTLRFDAGLNANTGDCPPMGLVVEVALASPHPWGDVDCGGTVDPVDALKKLRHDAGLNVPQPQGCPAVGADVVVTELG